MAPDPGKVGMAAAGTLTLLISIFMLTLGKNQVPDPAYTGMVMTAGLGAGIVIAEGVKR